MSLLHMEEILNLWIEVSGVDPESNFFTSSSYSVKKMHNQIREALELDPSEITAAFMLDHLSTDFLKNKTVTINDLVTDIDSVTVYLNKVHKLKNMLRHPDIIKASCDFTAGMKKLMSHYDFNDKYIDFIENNYEISFLRRDSLRSMQTNLNTHQFSKGIYEDDDVAPIYVKSINMFWNINSLIKACMSMPSGVSLNLIKHPMGHQSYFAFCIRNGGNIYILSDTPKNPHPLHAMMARRPDRDLEDRSFKNWFPYELLGLAYNEFGEAYLKDGNSNGLVPIQANSFAIKKINELSCHEATWIVMMFDQIIQKFWKNKHQEKAICYTSDVFLGVNAIEDATISKSTNLPACTTNNLPEVFKLTVNDVFAEDMDESAIGKTHGRPNQWMEDKYKKYLNDDIFNIVCTPDKNFALDDSDSVIEVDLRGESKLSYCEKLKSEESRLLLSTSDSTSFGTMDNIHGNRLYVARANAAVKINIHAKNDMMERKKEIYNFLAKKYIKNSNYFLDMLRDGDTFVKELPISNGGVNGRATTRNEAQRIEVSGAVKRTDTMDFKRLFMRVETTTDEATHPAIINIANREFGVIKCAFTSASPFYKVIFYPESADDLAEMCNCNISDLPDVLQHWSTSKKYIGNTILDRIDPMLWMCKDPWKSLDFRVVFHLSKRAMNNIKKGKYYSDYKNKDIIYFGHVYN